MQLIDPPTGTFTTQEVGRLMVYRAAVASGFFTDWESGAERLDTELLAWLRQDGAADGDAYPFTQEERHGLEQLRAARAAGRYSDDEPPSQPVWVADDEAK
jgi:hypothetical protein